MNNPEQDPLLIQHYFKDGDLEGLVIGNIGSGRQDVVVEETGGSSNLRTSVKTPVYYRLTSKKTGQELAEVVSAIARSLERETGEKPRVWTRIMKKESQLANWYNDFGETDFYRDMQEEKRHITNGDVMMQTERAQVVMGHKYLRAVDVIAGLNGVGTVFNLLMGRYVLAAITGTGMLMRIMGKGSAWGTIQITYQDPALRNWAETAVKAMHPPQLKKLSVVTETDKPYKPATA